MTPTEIKDFLHEVASETILVADSEPRRADWRDS